MSEKMGIIGRKLGMTRIFAEDGSAVAVTVVKAGPCPVTQVKTVENDGYCCKLNAELFIDDRNLGGLPDWGKIYQMIEENKSWDDIYNESPQEQTLPKKKKKNWFGW